MHPAMTPYVSTVVPVFDELDALPAFHDELTAALDELPHSAEVVYVDDGSTDGSTELLEKFQLERPELVRVVVLRRNFGKSGALAAGFDHSRGEVIVTLDADGQDVPAEVGTLLATLDTGYDLVGGWRRKRDDRVVKRVTSRLYNAVTRMMTGLAVHDFNTGFKAMRAEVAAELPLYGEFHRFVPVLAHDLGFRVGEVGVPHRPREAGTSKYLSVLRFPKTVLDLLTVLFLTRFADRPLHLFGGIGAALSGIGLVVLLYLSGIWFLTDQGIGHRPLLLFGVLAVIAGLQLTGTGFLGDVLRHAGGRERRPYRVRLLLAPADQEPADQEPASEHPAGPQPSHPASAESGSTGEDPGDPAS